VNRESLKSPGIGAIAVAALIGIAIQLPALLRWNASAESIGERHIYKNVGERELPLFVYKPKDWTAADQRICVVWFFGGGWKIGGPAQFSEQSMWLAKRGIISITVDYRIESTDGTTPFEAVKDARSALRWVRSNATRFGIDPGKVVAAGGSAGGHLAAACAIFSEQNENSDALNFSPVPDALLLLGPLLDPDIPIVHKHTGQEEFETYRAISPIDQLKAPLPPTLILHGAGDRVIPVESIAAFVTRAKQLGSPYVKLVRYQGMGHEFYSHGIRGNLEFKDTLERAMKFFGELGWLHD